MESETENILICPVCSHILIAYEKYLVCVNKHTFDIARQGYINLLLSHQKKSLHPGDNKDMVKSRFDFLKQNHYQPIADAINDEIKKYIQPHISNTINITDMGCGVGYYLANLKHHLDPLSCTIQYWGVDISKDAIQLAAQQHKNISWLVSNAVKLPFVSHSLDICLSVFSPFNSLEIKRVLSPQGMIALVTPGDSHLIELRNILFDHINHKDPERHLAEIKNNFVLEKKIPISFVLLLDSKSNIENLLKMTPFYWRSSLEKQKQLLTLNKLAVTIDVNLWLFSSNIQNNKINKTE